MLRQPPNVAVPPPDAPPAQATTEVPTTPPWLTLWDDVAGASASTATVLGVLAALYWVFKNRQIFPRAKVRHTLSEWPIAEGRLIHLSVEIENVGQVLLQITEARAVIQQLLPLSDEVKAAISAGQSPVAEGSSEILWDTLDDRSCDYTNDCVEIEPGETDTRLFSFLIPQSVAVIQVYTHLQNVEKKSRNIGWNTTSVHSFSGDHDGKEGTR